MIKRAEILQRLPALVMRKSNIKYFLSTSLWHKFLNVKVLIGVQLKTPQIGMDTFKNKKVLYCISTNETVWYFDGTVINT